MKDYSKNKSDLTTYYNVGKLIVEAQGGEARAKYGNGLIKEYSFRLTKELGKGYSKSNLKNMRQFYIIFSKGQAVPDQLTWSHYNQLIYMSDINKINYYIQVSVEHNLSYRQLRDKIKNNEYERVCDKTKKKLINKDKILPQDLKKSYIN